MLEQVPEFEQAVIADLLFELYGLSGEISPLVSFEDQNARIKSSSGTFVLKIANKKWSREFLKMQTDVLGYLKNSAADFQFPEIVPTKQGDEITYIDGFGVRLLTYLEGDLLASAKRSPELYKDIGRFLGQYSKAMQASPLEVADGSDPYWKLDNVLSCKKFLEDVIDLDAKDRIERLFDVYERDIYPKLSNLRKGLIHGDANEQNFLVSSADPNKIIGLIDFGEMQWSSQINELAITLAYSLLGEDDIETAANNIISGYNNEFPILDEEREILYYLLAMRLVTNITMTSHSAKLFPENEYILISQKPARALLKRLEHEGYILQ